MQGFLGVAIELLHKSDLLSLDQLALVETLGIGAHAVKRSQLRIVEQRREEQAGYSFGIGSFGHIGLKVAVGGQWWSLVSKSQLPLKKWSHVAVVTIRQKEWRLAAKYGTVSNVPAEQQKLNDELCLMAQIETTHALANLEEICRVPGVDIFIGPSDLAASLGVPGQTGHTRVQESGELVIRTAKQHGKLVAVDSMPSDFKFWVKAGVDVLFCTNDTSCLRIGAQVVLQQAREAVAQPGK
jgi:hypothetical protein